MGFGTPEAESLFLITILTKCLILHLFSLCDVGLALQASLYIGIPAFVILVPPPPPNALEVFALPPF